MKVLIRKNDTFMHIGMPRRSGRFPWGSGEKPFQSGMSLIGAIEEQRAKGMTDTEIARAFGMTTSQFRIQVRLAGEERKAQETAQWLSWREKGMSNVAIGKRAGVPESTVRNRLNTVNQKRAMTTHSIADALRESVKNYGCVDVGGGVEASMGISRERLNAALSILRAEGYATHHFGVEQKGIPGQKTSNVGLAGPYENDGARREDWKRLNADPELIHPITGRSEDMGQTWSGLNLKPVESVSSDRIMIREGKDGGSLKDGVIEIRRGVNDLDLGKARYMQVRVGVDGTHYMKGMAIYSDNMPAGVDVIFNTNKNMAPGADKTSVMKPMRRLGDGSINEANPFGATISRQSGALNVIREEGEWETWSKTLSSQFLSKQTTTMARKQLELHRTIRQEELNQIQELTNSAVRKKLLADFSEACDRDAAHLQAASLPRQANKVILPIPSLKPNEVYAPTFNNGEELALIRYPHGGTFEIPSVIVNNKNREGRSVLGTDARDAIGIHPDVAQRLSGADFDGDHVVAVPNPDRSLVRTSAPLRELRNFNHFEMYPPHDGMKTIDGGTWSTSENRVVYQKDANGNDIRKSSRMGNEMGRISNLITDMTIQGAPANEIARAVRHSMVVIDAEKHSLNFKLSEEQNGIASLRRQYQGGTARGGAATIISRAEARVDVLEREEGQRIGVPVRGTEPTLVRIDPETGRKLFRETGRTIQRRVDGEWIETGELATQRSTRMAEIQLRGGDARELVSAADTPIERVYAEHANRMMAMGNEARRIMVNTPPTRQNPSAAKVFSEEVATLNAQFRAASINRPIERDAQRIANSVTARQIQSNPGMTPEEIRRTGTQALTEARNRLGAQRTPIHISDREWGAIQAGALSSSRLTDIINMSDTTRLRELATPRERQATLSSSGAERARQMLSQGYTQAEVANRLGVSTTVLVETLYG